MIKLRADQEELRVKIRVALRTYTSVLAVAPTGCGKTVLAGALIKMIFAAGKRVIFAVHRINLIKQTAKTFDKFGIPYSFIAANRYYNPMHQIYIASILTLKNRMKNIKADYIFVDEAHLSAAAGWAAVSKHYKDNGAKQIGLTGTPQRLDGKPLGNVWDTMVLGPTVAWLIDNGFLSDYVAYAPKIVNTDGLHKRGGEFVQSEIEELMDGKKVAADALKHWRDKALNLRTIAFCPSVARAQQYAEEFTLQGVPSVALDAETPQAEREAAFLDFADGKIKVIFNCNLFCEGFDLAAQIGRDVTIECTMQLSPTMSLAKHLQQLGRALRAKDYKAVLLDLVGNIARLGLPDDDWEWSLDTAIPEVKEVKSVTCPQCFCTHHPAPSCTECGHEYPLKQAGVGGSRKLEEIEVELEEIKKRERRRAQVVEQAKAQTLEDLIAVGKSRKFPHPEKWAAYVWTSRQAKKGGGNDKKATEQTRGDKTFHLYGR